MTEPPDTPAPEYLWIDMPRPPDDQETWYDSRGNTIEPTDELRRFLRLAPLLPG